MSIVDSIEEEYQERIEQLQSENAKLKAENVTCKELRKKSAPIGPISPKKNILRSFWVDI